MENPGIIAAFWLLSAITVGSALAVFLSRNLIHAVVFLVLSFLGMAGLFLVLSADFIAVAQILIYAGAISILMVFAVMLTPLSARDNSNSLYVLPGVLLGRFIFDVIRYKRSLTVRNIQLALGKKRTPRQCRTIARRCYGFFGGLVFEILAMTRISVHRLNDFVVLENPGVLESAFQRRKGIVLVSGHIGHWELMGGALSLSGHSLAMYVGRQHNHIADRILNRLREEMGTQTFPKGAALRGIMKALKAGRIVAMLTDQHSVHRQHYIRFFGEPVSTAPGPASFVRRSGATLIFGWCIREGMFRYRARFQEIAYTVTDNEQHDILLISQS
ncbi:MAG: NADH-quinone oxidoreductase subunit J, partial [Chloroflexi bacterium]|nr:NADH-quinone oxidoreductase subunit J [Chloroflexota bacterium]